MKTGIELIAEERERQLKLWTPEHDSEHKNGELADAAAVYAMTKISRDFLKDATSNYMDWIDETNNNSPVLWPWGEEWYKPTPDDRIKELIKAGALIAAEIDRISASK